MRFIASLLLFAVAVGITASLSCPKSCKRKWCIRHVEWKLRCVGNLVKDACGCCYECAKQMNESCGGLWNINGICDVGLICNHTRPSLLAIRPGICVRKVQCHVHGGENYGQWIDVGQNFTLSECSQDVSAVICVCQEDGTSDCKKQKKAACIM